MGLRFIRAYPIILGRALMTQTMMSMLTAPARDGMRYFWVIATPTSESFPGFPEGRTLKSPEISRVFSRPPTITPGGGWLVRGLHRDQGR